MTEEKSSEYPLMPHARVQRGHYMVIIRLLTFARVKPLGVCRYLDPLHPVIV
jgi:hypothetical protein